MIYSEIQFFKIEKWDGAGVVIRLLILIQQTTLLACPMEEILKQLYHQKYQSLQKKRGDKIDAAQNHRRIRNYSHREDNTPSTQFTFDDQIRFQKEFAEISNQRDLSKDRYKDFQFPQIKGARQNKPKPKLKLKSHPQRKPRLRRAVLAVIFLIKLRKNIKRALLNKQASIQQYSSRLIGIITKLVHGYYYQLLSEQMAIYLHLLQNSSRLGSGSGSGSKSGSFHGQIQKMLLSMSRKLADSTITKQLLQFFVLICGSNSIIPGDYLSAMEINRLQFSQIYGSIIDVTPEQSRMLIGLGLGIKIFCLYILYRPYEHPDASWELRANVLKVKDVIFNVGSVFYFILMEEFCFNIKEIRSLTREALQSFGIRPIEQICPFSDKRSQPSAKHLICGQNRLFLNSLQYKNPSLIDQIRSNLTKWINRVSYACLKQIKRRSQKSRVVRKGNKSRLYRSLQSREGESILRPKPSPRPSSRARAI